MKVIEFPNRTDWANLLQRPSFDNSALIDKVTAVLNEVKQEGDNAIKKFTNIFDGVLLDQF